MAGSTGFPDSFDCNRIGRELQPDLVYLKESTIQRSVGRADRHLQRVALLGIPSVFPMVSGIFERQRQIVTFRLLFVCIRQSGEIGRHVGGYVLTIDGDFRND